MALQRLRNTILPYLGNRNASTRPSSVVETIQVYHEDVPPQTPLKDAKYRKGYPQRSLADTLGFFHTNKMYSTAKVYHFDDVNSPHRRDSVLDPPFASYFDPRIEYSISHLVDFGHASTEVLGDTYCSFASSRSTASPHQSLLPPLPHHLSSSEAPLMGRSPLPPPQRPGPVTSLGEQPGPGSGLESTSKCSTTPQQIEQLRQSTPPATFHRGRTTPSPPSALTSKFPRPIATSLSSVSTSAAATELDSAMPSLSIADTVSPATTASSALSGPTRNGTMIHPPSERRKRTITTQPEALISMVHGRSISLPLDTKSTSPIDADFDLGLPCSFETRRHSPTPTTADAMAPMPASIPGRTISLGIPTTSSAIQSPLEPFQEEPLEISAFDSDTDDEGPSPPGTIIRKMVSRPLLKASRGRAETVPATKGRNVSKGASLPKRVSKQDIKTPGLRLSSASENQAATHGISRLWISDLSTASASTLAISDTVTASSPTTLRERTLNGDSASAKSKRTSDASKTSKRSGSSSKQPAASAAVGGNDEAGGRRKRSSGKRLRSWFVRLFRRKNSI